jgi:hypothetical protein
MYGQIFSYGRYRYLKQSLVLVIVALILHFSVTTGEPPNGGTWQGYTLGGMSAALILILTWFGIRKRQYHCTKTSLSKWASAHVYLGISLPVVASLHCGFQFGWNVHTLAYALMIFVVFSGLYGLYAYIVFPKALTNNRSGINRKEMIKTIARLDDTGLTLAGELGAEAHHKVLQGVNRTRLGGTLWEKITLGDGLTLGPFMKWKFAGAAFGLEQATLGICPEDFLRNYLLKSQSAEEMQRVVELLKVLNERQSMVSRVKRDIRYHTLMKCWLFLHIPISIALLAAVFVHVISVFFYW